MKGTEPREMRQIIINNNNIVKGCPGTGKIFSLSIAQSDHCPLNFREKLIMWRLNTVINDKSQIPLFFIS